MKICLLVLQATDKTPINYDLKIKILKKSKKHPQRFSQPVSVSNFRRI